MSVVFERTVCVSTTISTIITNRRWSGFLEYSMVAIFRVGSVHSIYYFSILLLCACVSVCAESQTNSRHDFESYGRYVALDIETQNKCPLEHCLSVFAAISK